MKQIFSTSLFCLICLIVNGQGKDYNTKQGFVAEGYDVVSYFNGSPRKGLDSYQTTYDEVKFRFVNKVNLDRFINAPTAYLPQYGGWCAYAMAVQNKKVSVNPRTYEIRNGKLYLFYNGIMGNSLENWLSEGPERLIPLADANWARMNNE